MVDQATRFIAAFNEIEQHLRTSLDKADHVPFGALVTEYESTRDAPKNHVIALRAFASLRNAISHRIYQNGRPIAEPNPATVREIETLRDLLLRPPRALPLLGNQTVCTVALGDPLDVALGHIKAHDFSQLPIYDGSQYVGLLTTNTIARWLAAQFAEFGDLAEHATIREVYRYTEPTDAAVHVNLKATALDIIQRLTAGDNGAVPAAAVIFTKTGHLNQPPLGVAVAEDLTIFYGALQMR